MLKTRLLKDVMKFLFWLKKFEKILNLLLTFYIYLYMIVIGIEQTDKLILTKMRRRKIWEK